jgi:hypothetical protein
MIDLTITAAADGTGDDDGMSLAELADALHRIESAGASPHLVPFVRVNRHGRVRTIGALIDTTPSAPGDRP